ncbi:DNA-binding transcriptional MerR regulator [Prauserella sediminis]|uniref:DNA-binding transcriptional MerR regulator n=1 Tax=Prauserella sediminis TaxID=577680 RepID=A0A839XCC9_9PSEU|nr:MerR family transcriptional regulator [Prauserella sediminis]MBB3661622.1 DNA-binding transcriptional MerR regulator [Prauserella sediminis]
MAEHMQIGEVAERTGLSLRTIRYYEEVGLVVPSARSQGGFRLYQEPDVDRLLLIMRMKPLGFQLDEMRELLAVLDADAGEQVPDPESRLREFAGIAERRCAELRSRLRNAEEFAGMLRARLDELARPGS